MLLCIDLDDTLSLTSETILKYAKKFNKNVLCRKNKLIEINDCDDYYYFARMLNWNKKDLIAFFESEYPRYLSDIKIKPYTRKYLKLIKSYGVKIYIVTSRRETKNKVVERCTKEWLYNNQIEYDELYVNVINKEELIKDLNPTFFVDDSYGNCLKISECNKNINIYLMNTKYNSSINSKFKRISSIKDLWNLIREEYKE